MVIELAMWVTNVHVGDVFDKKYVDDWWHFCHKHHETAIITEISLESVGQFVEVPKVTFMKTREWSSSLAFNLEILWLSDYFCIKNFDFVQIFIY